MFTSRSRPQALFGVFRHAFLKKGYALVKSWQYSSTFDNISLIFDNIRQYLPMCGIGYLPTGPGAFAMENIEHGSRMLGAEAWEAGMLV